MRSCKSAISSRGDAIPAFRRRSTSLPSGCTNLRPI
jgi:hypothetical protein